MAHFIDGQRFSDLRIIAVKDADFKSGPGLGLKAGGGCRGVLGRQIGTSSPVVVDRQASDVGTTDLATSLRRMTKY